MKIRRNAGWATLKNFFGYLDISFSWITDINTYNTDVRAKIENWNEKVWPHEVLKRHFFKEDFQGFAPFDFLNARKNYHMYCDSIINKQSQGSNN